MILSHHLNCSHSDWSPAPRRLRFSLNPSDKTTRLLFFAPPPTRLPHYCLKVTRRLFPHLLFLFRSLINHKLIPNRTTQASDHIRVGIYIYSVVVSQPQIPRFRHINCHMRLHLSFLLRPLLCMIISASHLAELEPISNKTCTRHAWAADRSVSRTRETDLKTVTSLLVRPLNGLLNWIIEDALGGN